MSTMHYIPETEPNENTETERAQVPPFDSVEERRARRMKALKAVSGLWKDRKDIPDDGVDYQRLARSEWL